MPQSAHNAQTIATAIYLKRNGHAYPTGPDANRSPVNPMETEMNAPVLPLHVLPLDVDPQETQEWIEALAAVTEVEGRERAHYLIGRLHESDAARHGDFHGAITTPYVNTIAESGEQPYPGDTSIERRLAVMARWNAMAMVLRAGKHSNVGGHIATYGFSAFF